MADKIYVVEQSLLAANGTGLCHPIGSYSEESVAKRAKAEVEGAFKELLGAHLCRPEPGGHFAPIGLTLQGLFASYGVASFRVGYFATEPKGAILVAPSPMVRLQ